LRAESSYITFEENDMKLNFCCDEKKNFYQGKQFREKEHKDQMPSNHSKKGRQRRSRMRKEARRIGRKKGHTQTIYVAHIMRKVFHTHSC
jgi:hypothetical protein